MDRNDDDDKNEIRKCGGDDVDGESEDSGSLPALTHLPTSTNIFFKKEKLLAMCAAWMSCPWRILDAVHTCMFKSAFHCHF